MHSFITAMLSMALGGSVLTLAAILLRLAFRKLKAPAWLSVLLWAAVAVRLLIPTLPQTAVSVMPQADTVSEVVNAVIPAAQTPAPAQENVSTVSFSPNDPRPPAFPEGATGEPAKEEKNRFVPSAGALTAVWAAGAAVVLGWGFYGWLRLKRRVRVSVKGEDNVYFCDDIQSPFLLGVFAPRVCVPSGLEGEALKNVLAHERAHLKRRDHLIKPFAFLLLAAYWFNPLFWLAYALLCRDIEYACDEKVLKTMDRAAVAAYSQTLLTFHAPGRLFSACPVAFGEVGVKKRIKAALSYKKPAFWIVLAAALALAGVCVFLLTDRTADVTRIFPTASEEINAAVREAALKEVGAKGLAESAAEGHVTLGTQEKDGVTEVYAYCGATELGFVNGVLTAEGSGFAGPCTFLLHPGETGGYVCTDILWPKDGEGYNASVGEIMPPSLWRRARRNLTAIESAIRGQQTEMAEAYLRSLGREAEIELRRWALGLKTLTQRGVPLPAAERAEKALPPELEPCPSFVGTTEILENGVRTVYETALDAENKTIIYSKSDFASGSVLARAVFDAQTGALRDHLSANELPRAVQYTDPGALNGQDLVYGSKVTCDLNGNGIPDTLYLINRQQVFRLLAMENGTFLAESDYAANGAVYNLSYNAAESEPVRLTAHYFSENGILRLNAPVRLKNGKIETEPGEDGFPRYVDPVNYTTRSITTQFIPAAIPLEENESIRIYDADETRLLAGVLRHDPLLEQDFGTLETLYELTLDGKTALSAVKSAETGLFAARLCETGGFYGLCNTTLSDRAARCALMRFAEGKTPETLYTVLRDPQQAAALCVLKNGNIAVAASSPENELICAAVTPAGETVFAWKSAARGGRIYQSQLFPLPGGGFCFTATEFSPEDPSADVSSIGALNYVFSADGECAQADGDLGNCCGVCGEYLLFSKYEATQTEGQTLSLYKDGRVEARFERKPPENNVLLGFTQYGAGLLATCYGEGEVYVEAANGALSVQRFLSPAFAQYGGISSFGGTEAYAGVVFSESLGVYPSRTVLSVSLKDLIESDYPGYEVLAAAADPQPVGSARVRYAAVAKNKADETACTLFVINDYGVCARVDLAAGQGWQYAGPYGLSLEQSRVSFSLLREDDGGKREERAYTVTCGLRNGGEIEFKIEEKARPD